MSRPRVIAISVVTFFILIFIFTAANQDSAPIRRLKENAQAVKDSAHSMYDKVCSNEEPQGGYKTPSFTDSVFNTYDAIRHPMKDNYVDPSGTVFNITNAPWQDLLRSEVLVVDIDTRVPDGENQLFNPAKINWDTLDASDSGGMVSAAFINHFLWSQMHGYDYRFVAAEHMKGHHDTWIKPHILYDLLHSYRFVVFIDADATVSNLEVPLEWMLNRWNVNPEKTSIAMPLDTKQILDDDDTASFDSKGKMVLNTGVIIAQSLPYTFEMLNAWKTCTSEHRYKDCGQWKEKWSHEQRAFSEYIRYDFNPDGNNIVEIPCDEAMGYPGLKANHPHIDSDCNGRFVRHHTLDKDWVKPATANSMQQAMAQVIQKSLLKDINKYKIVESEKSKGLFEKMKEAVQ